MWYVKDQFSSKIYFKSVDVRKAQDFATFYNRNFKFCGQSYFKFKSIHDLVNSFGRVQLIDVNSFTGHLILFGGEYRHPLAVLHYHKRHVKYLQRKELLICKLIKKYHLWSYNGLGRKADGFDF